MLRTGILAQPFIEEEDEFRSGPRCHKFQGYLDSGISFGPISVYQINKSEAALRLLDSAFSTQLCVKSNSMEVNELILFDSVTKSRIWLMDFCYAYLQTS